jgi:hypothetical protein
MIRIVLIALTLQGCAVFEPVRGVPLHSEITARVVLTEQLPPNVNGYATIENGLCTVFLRRSHYPYCITHEIRHCFENHWHDEKPNSVDCMTQ